MTIFPRQIFQDGIGSVGAPVIDKDKLVSVSQFIHHLR